tara:strand:- start:1320 stop:1769 length:450 start_codon:yes stop_codon:yes gene_type:complete
MKFNTHLLIGLMVVLFFLPVVENKVIFIIVTLVASALPDIDTGFSTFGQSKLARPLQLFVAHRGIIHSFTMCVALSVVLAVIWPVSAFGFFMGYSFHLLADSFTVEGIRPFWPLKRKAEGVMRVGGVIEKGIFYGLVLIDVLLLVRVFV